MNLRLSCLSLCVAASLWLQPAQAGDDPTPRLCDPTGIESGTDDGDPAQIDVSAYCPEGEECYVGAYPADMHHINGGFCTVNQQRDGLKYVIFTSTEAPASMLRCVEASLCETACESYPIGEGISHDWTVYSFSTTFDIDVNPNYFAHENTLLVTHNSPSPVSILAKVTSPFQERDESMVVRTADPMCGISEQLDPTVESR